MTREEKMAFYVLAMLVIGFVGLTVAYGPAVAFGVTGLVCFHKAT